MKQSKRRTPNPQIAPAPTVLKRPIVIRAWRLFLWFYVLVAAPFAILLSVYLLFEMAHDQWNGWLLLVCLLLFAGVPLSVYGLMPALRAQRKVLLEIRNDGLWSPQTGAVPWPKVRFVGFRSRGATVTSTWLEVFVSSESEPDCAFDLDDTNIYLTRRLRLRLQQLTTVKIFRRELRSYQLVEPSRAATGNALRRDASSKIKAGVSSAPVRPKSK